MTRLAAGQHCAPRGHKHPPSCGRPPCVQALVTSGHELGLLHHPGRETDRVILLPKVKWESGRPVRLDLNLENVHIKHH